MLPIPYVKQKDGRRLKADQRTRPRTSDSDYNIQKGAVVAYEWDLKYVSGRKRIDNTHNATPFDSVVSPSKHSSSFLSCVVVGLFVDCTPNSYQLKSRPSPSTPWKSQHALPTYRPRQHDLQLVPNTTKLYNCNFVIRMLYKHSFWLYFIVHSLTALITF